MPTLKRVLVSTIMRKTLLYFLCSLCIGITVKAESADSVTVYFRQSHSHLDPAFHSNGLALDSIFSHVGIDSATNVHTVIKHVSVTGAASPEGTVAFNNWLSHRRAEAIFDQFRKREPASESTSSFTFLGRDWNGLKEKVYTDPNVPFRKDVLNLLEQITDTSSSFPHPLQRLKALRGGVPYRYLYHRIFPALREARLVVDYDTYARVPSPYLPRPDGLISPLNPSSPDVYQVTFLEEEKVCKPFYMALKTNMLYDAALLPNIGAEFYIGKGWALTADWMYGWWDKDRTHYYWRAYGGTIGARKWLGQAAADKPLTGHHLGVFAGVVTYDFELGGTGYMGGLPHRTLWDRCNYIAGIEYGYSLPVARRLNIDFTIGFGYLGGKYLKYIPANGFYQWQSTHHLRWIGPTKLEVALVWLIGCGNYNITKGGHK